MASKSRNVLKIFVFFLLLYLLSIVLTAYYMGFFSGKNSLRDNYLKHRTEISALYAYVNSIVEADGTIVHFETGPGGKLSAVTENGRWEAIAGSKEAEPLMNELAWTQEHIDTLKKLLKNAGCVAFTSANPSRDGAVFVKFTRTGMGYLIFDHTLDETSQWQYTGYGNTFYKDNVVFIHDGWWFE